MSFAPFSTPRIYSFGKLTILRLMPTTQYRHKRPRPFVVDTLPLRSTIPRTGMLVQEPRYSPIIPPITPLPRLSSRPHPHRRHRRRRSLLRCQA